MRLSICSMTSRLWSCCGKNTTPHYSLNSHYGDPLIERLVILLFDFEYLDGFNEFNLFLSSYHNSFDLIRTFGLQIAPN